MSGLVSWNSLSTMFRFYDDAPGEKLRNLEIRNAELTEKISALEKQAVELRSANQHETQKYSDVKADLAAAQVRVDTLRAETEILKAEKLTLQEQKTKTETELKVRSSEKQYFQNRCYALEKELSQMKQQATKLEVKVGEQKKQRAVQDFRFREMTKQFADTEMQSTNTLCQLMQENKAVIKDLTDKLVYLEVSNASQQERVTSQALALLQRMVSAVPNGSVPPENALCYGANDENSGPNQDTHETQSEVVSDGRSEGQTK